jgi:hypothetical protein
MANLEETLICISVPPHVKLDFDWLDLIWPRRSYEWKE